MPVNSSDSKTAGPSGTPSAVGNPVALGRSTHAKSAGLALRSSRANGPVKPAPIGPEPSTSIVDAALQADTLVAAARQGIPGAFDRLARAYRPRLYALALHITGSASDADDVTQEAFLQAYRCMHRFEGRSQFFTWLYRITLNQALSARRSKRVWNRRVADDRLDAALAVDGDDDPRRTVELREAYGLLLHALDQLSPTLRSTTVLIALQGLSYREAAIVLGTEEGTIAWRVHEARRQIRAHVARLERPAPGDYGHPMARYRDRLHSALRWVPELALG